MDMSLTTLSPEAITIEEIIGDDQNITENTKGYWVWSLQANETGRYNLILVASIQNSNSTNYVEVFDKIINVKNKPKKKFKIFLQFPEGLKRYDENIIKLDVLEYFSDAYSFEWGGEGKIVLEFDGKVDIITDENIINDKKSGFSYKWTVIPEGKEKVLPYTIKIIGDYEDLVIVEHTIPIQKNFKEGSKRFIDNVLKRWYWVFTALIIPISGFIRKKYFKKK